LRKKVFRAKVPIIALLAAAIQLFGIFGSAVSASAEIPESRPPISLRDNIEICYEIDADSGILSILVSGAGNKIMYRLTKDDMIYTYRYKSDERAAIPLNMGNGEYTLIVGVMISDTMARVLWRTTLSIELDCDFAPFLSSSKIVKWTEEMPLVETARSLVVENNPRKTALEIGRYIAERFSYNYSITSKPSGYIPDLIQVYEGYKGICYDFAALYAAMCRAVGIPTKLIMGFSSYMRPEYHAWNLVKIDGDWYKFDSIYSMYRGAQFLDISKTIELRRY